MSRSNARLSDDEVSDAAAVDPVFAEAEALRSLALYLHPSDGLHGSLGDAVALTLMRRRGYSWDSVLYAHPGGAVGRPVDQGSTA